MIVIITQKEINRDVVVGGGGRRGRGKEGAEEGTQAEKENDRGAGERG